MKRSLGTSLVVLGLLAPLPALATTYHADLVPMNNSGVTGSATLTLQDNVLNVSIDATGLEPNRIHAQHIHGLLDGAPSSPAGPAQDLNHDGLIEDKEAEITAGNPIISLTRGTVPFVGEAPADSARFPIAGADGTEHFSQTYVFNTGDPVQASALNRLVSLDLRSIELHGMSVPETVAGTPNPFGLGGRGHTELVYEPTLPVAYGQIVLGAGVSPPPVPPPGGGPPVGAVPEPASLSLLGLGLAALGWRLRRGA